MRLQRFESVAILLAAIVLPALAQQECPTTSAVAQIPPRRHGPVRNLVLHEDGSATSENWSGYIVTGSAFTQAAGSWTVPAIDCSQTPNAWALFWVGIDGYGTSTVEQTGTGSYCTGTTPSYDSWWEFYPSAGSALSDSPVSVSPGDQISAQVSYSDSQSQFTITITNETAQQSYSCWYQPELGAERTSAEWIAETPTSEPSGQIAPLADFGTVDFGQTYTNISGTNNATDASTSGPISAFGTGIVPMTMVNSGGMVQGVPSILSPDGASFTVTWDGPDFSLSAPPSETLIRVVAGQSGTVSLSILPENGFSSQVNFTCSGLPVGAACSFSPSSVTPNGVAAASSTLTINTTATSMAMRLPTAPSHRPIYALLFPGLGMIAIFGLTARRKLALPGTWLVGLLILLIAASELASCGGGGRQNSGIPTPPGTSTVYVTASSSGPTAISQTLPVTLVVTQ